MLCMDGGGAKGVIEATILDKIFVTVAATLKVWKFIHICFMCCHDVAVIKTIQNLKMLHTLPHTLLTIWCHKRIIFFSTRDTF